MNFHHFIATSVKRRVKNTTYKNRVPQLVNYFLPFLAAITSGLVQHFSRSLTDRMPMILPLSVTAI